MANLFSLGFGKVSDLIGKLAEAGLTAEMAEEIRKNPALASIIVDALKSQPTFTLVHGLFTSTEKQIQKVREWNKQFGWGISDEAFAEAEKSVPAWPKERLVAVVLVPYLADKKNEEGEIMMTGVERTFHELWARASAEQDVNWRWDGYDKADSDRLRLLSGIEHKVGLRWEVIDLGSNRNKKPMDIRSPSSPHAGVLAAAALHPEWIKVMDGENVPYVFISGYEVQAPGVRPWAGVPLLSFDRGHRKIRLICYWCGNYDSFWAVPSFFRE